MRSTPGRIYPSHQKSTNEKRKKTESPEQRNSQKMARQSRRSPAVRQYWSYRDELTCLDGLLFKGDKIIVPKTLQSEMLEKIHETYLGIVKCKNRARQALFWPGMSVRIEETVTAGAFCAESLKRKRKGTTDSDGDSRTTLGEGRGRSFWDQQPTLSAHSGLLLKVARNLQTGQSVSQERHFINEESDLQVWNFRWADIRQRTSVCLCKICSIHERLRHQTHNIQSLPPASKRESRKNCTNCQRLIGEGERSSQSATWLQKQCSRHWILSCSAVPGQTAEADVTDNIQTPTTRTWKFEGASHRNGLSPAEVKILLRQEG